MTKIRIGLIPVVKRFALTTGLVGLMTGMGTVTYAVDFSSSNFTVKNPSIEELGGFATSTSFQLWGSIPFISPRQTTSTSFILSPGFLSFPTGTVATTTPPPVIPPSGGGGGGGGGALKPRPPMPPGLCLKVDFNQDSWIDFVDFSILLYYFDKEGDLISRFDLNADATVDLIDISIFMYYWNGDRIKCTEAPEAPPGQNKIL